MELIIKKSHLKIAVVSVFLLVLIVMVGFFIKDLNLTGSVMLDSSENITSDFVNVGEAGVLYAEGSDIVVLAVTIEDLAELIKTATEEDMESYLKIFSEGRAYTVPIATRAGVLERNSNVAMVKILDGEFEGASGWVPSEWIIK